MLLEMLCCLPKKPLFDPEIRDTTINHFPGSRVPSAVIGHVFFKPP